VWSRVLIEKLPGPQLVKKHPSFMKPEGSRQHSQAPATKGSVGVPGHLHVS